MKLQIKFFTYYIIDGRTELFYAEGCWVSFFYSKRAKNGFIDSLKKLMKYDFCIVKGGFYCGKEIQFEF